MTIKATQNTTTNEKQGSQDTINILSPNNLKVIKRNGKVATFDAERIQTALMKAFVAVEGSNAANSSRVSEQAKQITQRICRTLSHRWHDAGIVQIRK